MYDKVLIRYGDLMLKGRNRKSFIDRVNNIIAQNFRDLDVDIIRKHDRVYLTLNETPHYLIEERLQRVTGIYSFSFVKKSGRELKEIIDTAISILNKEIKEAETLKINVKRADKKYPYTSPEITKIVAPEILKGIMVPVNVDLHQPQHLLTIEIREEGAFLFLKTVKGLGGFPVGVGGKAGLLLSGGIDSPVAGFLMMKQGLLVEGLHFESTPLTPVESLQKIIDIGKELALYTVNHQFKVVMIPFLKMHQAILSNINESYHVTIMRRMMIRIAEAIAFKRNLQALVTGESLGQVASQTIESLITIEKVGNIPILRPLISFDKKDIIKIADQIKTKEISIRPFEDCCTIYLPKNPVTKPTIKRAEYYESFISDFQELIEEIVKESKVITITPETTISLANYGFDSQEIWEALKGDNLISEPTN